MEKVSYVKASKWAFKTTKEKKFQSQFTVRILATQAFEIQKYFPENDKNLKTRFQFICSKHIKFITCIIIIIKMLIIIFIIIINYISTFLVKVESQFTISV